MTDQKTTPEDGDEQEGGGWFSRNWKSMLAVFGLVGGVMAMLSGVGEWMLVGLALLAVGLVALFAPEMFGKAGDALNGAYHQATDKVKRKWNLIVGQEQEPELTAEQLATNQEQLANMSTQERAFEQWALQKVKENKITGAENKKNLKALLDQMRKDESTLDINAANVREDDTFINGLPPELKAEAQTELGKLGTPAPTR